MQSGSLIPGLAAALLLCLVPVAVAGVFPDGPRRVADQRATRPNLSLDEAVRQVQRQTGGRILAADAVPGPNGVIYRIKVLLPSGRVKVIHVDSRR